MAALEHMGYRLVAYFAYPHDVHLSMVLARLGEVGAIGEKFATWIYNHESGMLSLGHYCRSLDEGLSSIEERTKRYRECSCQACRKNPPTLETVPTSQLE